MGENKNNFNSFNAASIKDWEIAARQELNSANPWEKLTYQGKGWSIVPYYDRNESRTTISLLKSSQNEFSGPNTWYNCPYLKVEDAKTANENALKHLREDADGIFFELNEEVDFEILLKDIESQYCSLNFLAKRNKEALAASLLRYLTEKKNSWCIFWKCSSFQRDSA